MILCIYIDGFMIPNFLNRYVPRSDSSSYLQVFIPKRPSISHKVNKSDYFVNTLSKKFFEKVESYFEKVESFFEEVESFFENMESYFVKVESYFVKVESFFEIH